MTDTLEDFVNFWSVHSTKDKRPVYRGWAKSEAAATTLMEEIRKEDGDTEDQYWVLQMTESELEAQQAMGEIPKDA